MKAKESSENLVHQCLLYVVVFSVKLFCFENSLILDQ